MNFLQQALAYIFTAANWSGKTGLGTRILKAPAVHRRRRCGLGADRDPDRPADRPHRPRVLPGGDRRQLAAGPPTLVLLLGVLLGSGPAAAHRRAELPRCPALLAGTYAGIANVDPKVVDAARSMGTTERRVLTGVELPNARR